MSHVSDKLDIVPPTLAEIDQRIEAGIAAEHQLMIDVMGEVVAELQVDRERYLVMPVMSDGSEGPPLELRALFEQFFSEVQ
jgi:hypothetical protein